MGRGFASSFLNKWLIRFCMIFSILGQLYGVNDRFSAGDYYQGDLQELLNYLMQHDRNHVYNEDYCY